MAIAQTPNWLPYVVGVAMPLALLPLNALLRPHLDKISTWSAGLTRQSVLRFFGSSVTLSVVNLGALVVDARLLLEFFAASGPPTREQIFLLGIAFLSFGIIFASFLSMLAFHLSKKWTRAIGVLAEDYARRFGATDSAGKPTCGARDSHSAQAPLGIEQDLPAGKRLADRAFARLSADEKRRLKR